MSLRLSPLPISGWEVILRAADGLDDVLLQETEGPPLVVALSLLSRLASSTDGGPLDWERMTVTDFEVLLLRFRASVFGGRVECDLVCTHPGCGARLEIPFRIEDYLRDVRPRRPRGVAEDAARAAWFSLDGAAFRLPTVGDQAAVIGRPKAAHQLAERCIAATDSSGRVRARVERAMELLAPPVSRPLHGTCPSCGERVEALFYVPAFVVGELRRATASVFDDVHAIASAYQWTEASILGLPRTRRRQYAELAQRQLEGAM